MKTTETDVVVIGGGVIGCTTAYRLAQAGLSVTVVERGDCGREASWAGAGILIPGSYARTDPLASLRRESLKQFGNLTSELFERTGVDPQYIVCGGIDLVTDDNQDAAVDREVAAAAGHTTNDGKPIVERLSAEQVRTLEPALTGRFRGALLIREVAQVRNPRLMTALVLASTQVGVRFLTHTPVMDLVVEGSRVTGVRTGAGEITARHVVLAAGAWSSRIADRLAGRIEVYPVRGQIVLLQMLPRPFTHVIEHGKTYLVCRRDGKIVIGSTEEHESGFDKRNTASGIAKLLQLAERFVPSLTDAILLRTWAGLRPCTPDRTPYIGPVPGLDGLLAATGHFRGGLILAPITADIITQFITKGKTTHDIDAFQPGRSVDT